MFDALSQWRPTLESDDLQLSIVRNETGLAALRDDWIGLYGRALDRSPSATYDWISLCWEQHRGDCGKRLHVIAVRSGGRLVLIAPLLVQSSWTGLGIVSWIDSKTPFYSDILLEDSAAGQVAARLAASILVSDRGLLRMRLNLVPENAAAQHLLKHLKARRNSARAVGIMDVAGFSSGDAFLTSLSQNLRRDYTRTRKMLAKRGSVEITSATTAEDVREATAWLFETKRGQLQQKGTLSEWFADRRTEALFADACMRGLTSGDCKLYLLKLNGALIAAELVFTGPNTYYLSKSAYNAGFPKASLGTLLRLSVIMDAIAHGVTRIDFMLGTYEWKDRMKSSTESVVSYRIDGFLLARLRWWH